MRNILKKIGGIWKTDGQEGFKTPKEVEKVFKLMFKDLTIGVLYVNDGIWEFQYSPEFKSQNILKPLPDFPDLSKKYSSEELYPFFVQRIPSDSQPKVMEVIKEEKIDQNNEVALLERFGKFSTNNPFKLTIN
ncbi:MAG: HipA N-terminal domain-containing protein [Saprospiraceae bacterium]|nr:HipA N-terminal domain-containing protein [Saprospiraceae bacterium]